MVRITNEYEFANNEWLRIYELIEITVNVSTNLCESAVHKILRISYAQKKMGKPLISHRYNRLSLLPSGPGEVHRSWSYKTYPVQR
jgi:hypothetical protein